MSELHHRLTKEVPLHLSAPTLEITKGAKWEPKVFDPQTSCELCCSVSAQHLSPVVLAHTSSSEPQETF